MSKSSINRFIDSAFTAVALYACQDHTVAPQIESQGAALAPPPVLPLCFSGASNLADCKTEKDVTYLN